MRVLLIDDKRDVLADVARCFSPHLKLEYLIARTYADGIKALETQPLYDMLYLDHDLGEEKTGYDIVCWLEQNPRYLPLTVMQVSSNPVGRKRMAQVLEKLFWFDKFGTGGTFIGRKYNDEGVLNDY